MSVLNILNMLYNLHFFSSKCRLFHNAPLLGFCITHILIQSVLKFEKKMSVAKRLIVCGIFLSSLTVCNTYLFLTRSVKLIVLIFIQHHISKLSRFS